MSEPYSLNDVAELDWEIVRDGWVVETVRKTSDDDNRDEAERRVAALNREAAK